MKQYSLTVNEEQLIIINAALEEYFRIGMLQFFDLAERLAYIDITAKYGTLKGHVDDFCCVRDEIEQRLRSIPLCHTAYRDESCEAAVDIWHVIKHQLWKDNPNHNTWTVDSEEPFQYGKYALPKIESLEIR